MITKRSERPPTLDFEHLVKGREDTKVLLNDLANVIGPAINEHNPNMGFALMIFDFGEGGDFLWASNAQRADMIKMMQEALVKLGEHG